MVMQTWKTEEVYNDSLCQVTVYDWDLNHDTYNNNYKI